MFLTDIPEDVIIIIIKMLDLKTIKSLYDTCEDMRRILTLPGVVKIWDMSLNTMATVQCLKTDFFKGVANNLQEINMCGVIDVCKTTLMPALKRLKHLKTLDVTYTDIDILDFYDMYDACPTIKNIGMNLTLNKSGHKLPQSMIERGQSIFEKMENVHFVSTTVNFLYSDLARYILHKANLKKLKFSVIHKKMYGATECEGKYDGVVKFHEMYVHFMNLKINYGSAWDMPILRKLNSNEYEFIIIANGVFLDEIVVYVTPIFKDFFQDRLGMTAKCFSEFNNDLSGNMAVMVFTKANVSFDDIFYTKLLNRLKESFPIFFLSDSQAPVPDEYEWFFTSPAVAPYTISKPEDFGFKKRRMANPSFCLDFDAAFINKNRFKLSLTFVANYAQPVTLSPSSDFLRKITFLSLTGTIRYSAEFFNVLFRCCSNLITLDVTATNLSPCVAPISHSVPLSETLKNLRLIDKRFDYNTFFQSLSQCKTLENIYVVDNYQIENTNLADPSILFRNCNNLYSICIKACISNATKKKMDRVFNNAKVSQKKYHLNINLCQISSRHEREEQTYDPYIDVFNVYPIKPGSSF